MAEIKYLNKTPGELAEEANLKSNVGLSLDNEDYPTRVVNKIREDNVSLSKELSLLRKTLKLVCDKVGLVNEDFENYNTLVETIKEETKEGTDNA